MDLLINNLASSEVITSSNFAKKSNVIYSEIVSHGEYEKSPTKTLLLSRKMIKKFYIKIIILKLKK